MPLSKRDFQAAADILKEERASLQRYEAQASGANDPQHIRNRASAMALQIDRIEEAMCAWFKSENPRFNFDTFRKAAQP